MKSFWPTVLAGLAGAGVAALAGHKPWVSAKVIDQPGGFVAGAGIGDGVVPLAGALALVALAAWGVLLVTRGRVRRALALLTALVSLGVLAVAIDAFVTLPDDLATTAAEQHVQVDLSRTLWQWVTPLAALVSAAAAVAAYRLAPRWPEMSRRYDAPSTVPAAGVSEDLDVWKALDQGLDPTESPSEQSP